jgi:hypothetical protein
VRRARVVHEGVECNTRLAFKRRVGAGDRFERFVWRLYVLDLATLSETALIGATRNVDDQVEWLDNDNIVYALPDDARRSSAATNSWVLPANRSDAPRLLMSMAFSPAVSPIAVRVPTQGVDVRLEQSDAGWIHRRGQATFGARGSPSSRCFC